VTSRQLHNASSNSVSIVLCVCVCVCVDSRCERAALLLHSVLITVIHQALPHSSTRCLTLRERERHIIIWDRVQLQRHFYCLCICTWHLNSCEIKSLFFWWEFWSHRWLIWILPFIFGNWCSGAPMTAYLLVHVLINSVSIMTEECKHGWISENLYSDHISA